MREDPAAIAAPEVLRRVRWAASAWGVAGAVGLLAVQGARPAAVLTGVALVSIVAFRGLEGVVRRLRVDEAGALAEGNSRRFVLRWLLLLAVPAAVPFLESRDVLAVVMGLSVVPLAFLTEAAIQLASWLGKRES